MRKKHNRFARIINRRNLRKTFKIESQALDPLRLVKKAYQINKKRKRQEVWCIFDKDDCPDKNFNKAIRLAKKYNIEVAYTNEAFELWYLLHFDFHQSALSRKQYEKKLSEKLKEKYRKNDTTIYSKVLRHQNVAIENAEKLLKTYSNRNPAKNNPSTTVHFLVKKLNECKSK